LPDRRERGPPARLRSVQSRQQHAAQLHDHGSTIVDTARLGWPRGLRELPRCLVVVNNTILWGNRATRRARCSSSVAVRR
jgi:hypothetical protein